MRGIKGISLAGFMWSQRLNRVETGAELVKDCGSLMSHKPRTSR